MKKITIHLYNYLEGFHESVQTTIKLASIPRVGEWLYLTEESEKDLEKQIMASERMKELYSDFICGNGKEIDMPILVVEIGHYQNTHRTHVTLGNKLIH